MDPPSSDLVQLEANASHLTIRLNRPESLNALNADLVTALHETMTRVTEAPEKPLLLTGAGRATCAGMDTDLVSQPDYRTRFADTDEKNRQARALLREYPYPTVMAAKGAVIGAGFLLSVACDLVVLGEECHYSLPEVQYDIVAPSTHLERLVGPRLAKEIQLTGEPIAPDRAAAIGLVNTVVPEDEVDDTARALIEDIGRHDLEVIRAITHDYRSRDGDSTSAR